MVKRGLGGRMPTVITLLGVPDTLLRITSQPPSRHREHMGLR